MVDQSLTVLVLGGGPDRERPVSLQSAAAVAEALRKAGHQTIERDILPDDTSALDETCDAVFPVLHGAWGEGGPLQAILEASGKPFVGWRSEPAAVAMDKAQTKGVAHELGIATPDSQLVPPGAAPTLAPPVVVKPVDDGSSVGVHICHDYEAIDVALAAINREHGCALVETFVAGRETTVGVLDGGALPVIEIVPTVDFYDFEAKYDRDDTDYRFEIDLPEEVLTAMQADAVALHRGLGGRHLSRVDFIVDDDRRPWLLEINTLPGFTSHSLLPMAAAKTGLAMPALCDRLVSLALRDGVDR